MENDRFDEVESEIGELPTTGFGFLYVLYGEGTNFIKIGRAENVSARIQQLQVGCPYRLLLLFSTPSENAVALERLMHDHFAAHHLHGDWFSLPDNVPSVLHLLAFLYSHSRGDLARPPADDSPLNYEDMNVRIVEVLQQQSPLTINEIMSRLDIEDIYYGRMRKKLHDLFHARRVGKSGRGLYRATSKSEQAL